MDMNDEHGEELNLIVTMLVGIVAYLHGAYYLTHFNRRPQRNCYLTQREFVSDVTRSNEHCHNLLRMNVESFQRFVYIFRGTGRLKDTVHCSIEEQLAMFLHIVSHNVKNRSAKFYSKRSGETISRHFNTVLDAITGMEDNFLKQPTLGTETPKEIRDNNRMWPYFKDYVGAIDGTHLPAKVPIEYVARFRGKYYLVDAGFPLLEHYITPFRSTRYHLNEIRGRVPKTPKELFNHRHSSLRNAIERAFRMLKKRFRILVDEPMFRFENQVKLVIACCIIHDHIRGVMPDDPLLNDVDHEIGTQSALIHDPVENQLTRAEDGREGKRI
ncbi:uncharacterized protein LOC132282061 [Cornus florida]|uniref:uncharacterized protein LOC132282061 n=1 Tax=Cornus florida TaxID=4283 RepID=UPI00289DE633|nr:uncharacterized protein LOC132282061 [Cornus florida]